MLKKIKNILLNFINSRTVFLYVLFFIMSCVLFNRIFLLQIVEGADKQAEFEMKIKKAVSYTHLRAHET